MYKFHCIKNWYSIYEAPYICLFLEDGSALVNNVMPAAIPEVQLQNLTHSPASISLLYEYYLYYI